MPDNRLLQGKITDATEAPSPEAQLRQALELMGGRRPGNVGSPSASNRQLGPQSAQRHRYVRDGEVPVVHAPLGRPGGRPQDASSQHDKALIESLRHELDRERAGREMAERTLGETRSSLVALQTRLAHLEMDLQAAQAQAAAQQAAAQQAQQVAAQQAIAERSSQDPSSQDSTSQDDQSPMVRRRARLGRPPRAIEPEPVKWWIRAEKS